MPFPIEELIHGKPKPTSVNLDTPMGEAAEIMLTNEFTQLPVVDDDGKVLGIITTDSMIRALCSFNCGIARLCVRDGMSRPALFRPEDDVFDLLRDLEVTYSALIVDREDMLLGIVTAFDTTEFFRERSEDVMVIEDIETAIKDHIKFAHVDEDGELDQESLKKTINRVLPGAKERNRGRFIQAVKYCLESSNMNSLPLDHSIIDEALERLFGPDKSKNFEELTLYEYISLLLDDHVWDQSLASSGMEPEIMRGLLDDVRDIRNSLFHFRGNISVFERQRLRACSEWFSNHPPLESIDVSTLTENEIESMVEPSMIREKNGEYSTEKGASEFILSENPLDPMDSRYAPLAEWLLNCSLPDRKLKLSLNQIEDIINDKLPTSAYKHRAWWANDDISHPQSKQWLDAGWRVSSVLLTSQEVTFMRIKEKEQEQIAFFNQIRGDLKATPNFPLRDTVQSGANWFVVARFLKNGKQTAVLALSFLRKNRFRVELCLNRGDADKNKIFFDQLFEQKGKIEKAFGGELKWERMDKRRESRICVYHPDNISRDEEGFNSLRDWSVDNLLRLYRSVVNPLEGISKAID